MCVTTNRFEECQRNKIYIILFSYIIILIEACEIITIKKLSDNIK